VDILEYWQKTNVTERVIRRVMVMISFFLWGSSNLRIYTAPLSRESVLSRGPPTGLEERKMVS
jgi:hypothetical protein